MEKIQFSRKSFILGSSIAASWAWGTSLIVGMQIAQQKGLAAWFIWAIANAGTLAFFGLLAKAGIVGRRVFDKKAIKWTALVIQGFCLIIQLNIINQIVLQLGASSLTSYFFASLIGIIFTVWMYKHGLKTSIYTDKYQWLFAMIAICAIIVIGFWSHVPHWTYPESTGKDLMWGVWSACILLSGPIGDVQHWQRADVAGQSNAYLWASLLFAVYMLLVLTMSLFHFSYVMNVILLIAALNITSSTIDSIAVAMHEISNKTTGTAIALFLCVFWGAFAKVGIIDLWSYAGIYRVGFASLILGIGLCLTRKFGTQKPSAEGLLEKTVD